MKPFYIAGLLVLLCSFFVQDNTSLILWQKKNLRWKNFTGVADSIGPHAKALAGTYSRLEQRYYRVNNEIHFVIAAWFNPAKSWVRKGVVSSFQSDRVLRHEQHHFDMCELYARQIRKYLSSTVFREATYKTEVEQLFKKFHEQYRAEQERYDSELKEQVHTLDDWANAIDQELKELSKFTDTALVVKMQ